ncbi:hypothetical protein GEV29_03135 [Aeromicrobium sp. SMF47]|uniref:Uncharacterized protein n=1 Tax=Aeromicrobium yanjiei TaxID=2662028 RepID=A0A5Q2MEI0_9ACTN|nr:MULTISPECIES: hypothetical protein [Aeromicrobium]MRJ75520.1 hypothetical protein [Aeromicrobium yanjiei]MRK02457.1 hypothetical protein [Aeromicrobium sp. S22]QGG40061.1 hypothetical protein GEV26_00955 [Aeromicrobium yanjiei]
MTEPQSITADHVRSLLAAGSGATIGLIEGRVEVISAEQAGTDDYAGALEVVAHDDLVDQIGEDASDERLAAEAEALTIQVQQIGG